LLRSCSIIFFWFSIELFWAVNLICVNAQNKFSTRYWVQFLLRIPSRKIELMFGDKSYFRSLI
jgi:hypothetical protein